MKAKIIVITICFFVGFMGIGFAQTGGYAYSKHKTNVKGMKGTKVTMENAHQIIGMRVTNKQGKDLGWVDDLIFKNDGSLSCLIVSKGGVQASEDLVGLGGELIPIPFSSIRNGFFVGESWVTIPVTIGQFDTAPRFLKYELDTMRNSKWQEEARAYFEN